MSIASTLSGLAVLLGLVALALTGLAIARAGQGRPMRGMGPIVIGVFVAALLVGLLSMGIVTIEPDKRGIVVSYLSPKGYREQILQPGISWILPGLEHVILYPISKQTYTMSIAPGEGAVSGDDSVAARTADGQEVYVDASVIYEVNPLEIITVHIAWQNRYTDELVRPQARGIIRNAVAQFKVEEIISTKRTEMIAQIADLLATKLKENGLTMVDFVLRNITFSTDYATSVEQKQIAEQQALQAAYVVNQKKQEAEQARQVAQGAADAVVIASKGAADARVIQAKAEAEALNLISEVLKANPDLLTYQYITKLAPNVQVMYLPSGQNYLVPLPTPPPASTTTTP